MFSWFQALSFTLGCLLLFELLKQSSSNSESLIFTQNYEFWAKHSEFTQKFWVTSVRHHNCYLNGSTILSRSKDMTKWRCFQKICPLESLLSKCREKNPAYGQHSALSCVCDIGVPIPYHESESIPWVFSIPWVYVYAMSSFYTISQCLYHESMCIPWVHVYTMSPCQYHESMYIPWIHVYTVIPCSYHESMYIPWVLVNTMSPCLYHESLSIPWVHVYTMCLCYN